MSKLLDPKKRNRETRNQVEERQSLFILKVFTACFKDESPRRNSFIIDIKGDADKKKIEELKVKALVNLESTR